MIYNLETAKITARHLLQIKAIKINPTKPFVWTSGWKSPIYCDNRKTLSYPAIRTYLRQEFVKCINDKLIVPDVIAGVATGGIPHGVLVANELGLPFIYVRTEAKGHGLQNKIEGELEKGKKVIIIEDLISTGKTSYNVVETLRDVECRVVGMLAIFSYGFDIAHNKFKESNCPLYTLSDYNTVIDVAVENGLIPDEYLNTLKEWRKTPDTWGQ